ARFPRECEFHYLDGRVEHGIPTPLLVEEDALWGINAGNMEGGHCNTDKMAHTHRGGGYYATIDGSVQWFKEPPSANSWNWYAKSPHANLVSFGNVVTSGWWNTN